MRGSVVKKSNGRYYIVFYVGKKQKWESVPDPNTKKNAESQLAQRITEINRGEYREVRKVAFADFANQWYRHRVEAGDLKPATRSFYRRNLDLHVLPELGDRRLVDVRLDALQELVTRKRLEGLAPSTVNGIITTLTAMFRYAMQSDYLRENPATYIRRPKTRKQEADFLTTEEVRALLDHTPERWYALFLMGVTTGLRRGELLAVKWENVDWRNSSYYVKETLALQHKDSGPMFAAPKSRESEKPVDLTPLMLDVLRQCRKRQAAEKLQAGEKYQDNGLVFCQPNGAPLDPDNFVRRVFHRALRDAGLRRIRFHDLRHTCATLLVAQGENPKYIQRQMRHASITTTLNVYGHLMPEVRQDAAERLDRTLFGTPERRALEER